MTDAEHLNWNVTKNGSYVTVFVNDKDGNLRQTSNKATGRMVRGILIEKGLPMPKKRTVSAEEAVAARMEIGDCAVLETEEQAETLKKAMEEMKRAGKEFQYFDTFNNEHWRVFRVE